jgi:hypothetical protein
LWRLLGGGLLEAANYFSLKKLKIKEIKKRAHWRGEAYYRSWQVKKTWAHSN